MDNCSAHENMDTLPNLTHAEIEVPSPNTTIKMQPLDDSIIPAIKLGYQRRQIEHAADLLEVERDL